MPTSISSEPTTSRAALQPGASSLRFTVVPDDQAEPTLAASVKAKGWALEQEPTDQPWGWRDFSVVDPDGFEITIARA